MEIFLVFILAFASIGLIAYQYSSRKLAEIVHLPDEIKGQSGTKLFDFKELLTVAARFTDRLVNKGSAPLENLKKKLINAGRPMNTSQFFAFKILLMAGLPFATVVLFHPEPLLLTMPLALGFMIPEFWLNNAIKNRQAAVLRDLPHVIDLLNICVGAGLDFMLAVNRVIEDFKPCILIKELKILLHEIQMGSSRRDALKGLANRINSSEVVSFVRTLLQADRMGTPIGDALKMQAEEIRIRRFQKGEEMALKAPIKLLFPLLFFILPVVLIIVAGPILIQFTRGGFMKF
jgi:tight adherence protein C